jgi:hypothetical protein
MRKKESNVIVPVGRRGNTSDGVWERLLDIFK